MSVLRRVYRLLLRLLPGALRSRHGEAMEALYVKQVRQARAYGPVHGAAAAAAGMADVIRCAWHERRRKRVGGVAAGSGGPRGRTTTLEWTMEMLRQDVVQAMRSLVKAPRFSVVAVLTLALGIGANSAIFSVVDGVLLKPLPFPEPDQVVHLGWVYGRGPGAVSPTKFAYYREHTRSFQGVATYRGFLGRLDAGDHVAAVDGLRVSDDFLDVTGFRPVKGRSFTAAEQAPDGPAVAIISERIWHERFGGSPDVVGATLRMNEQPYTVVGVLPSTFTLPELSEAAQVLVPLALRPDPRDEGANYPVLARLRPGVSPAEAQADLDRLMEPFAEAYPNQVYEQDQGMRIVPFDTLYFGGLSTALWIVMGAVGLVLLIACANVANLLLARSTRRRREIAVRAALGATRGRIARLVLTESVLVALAAGVLGLGLAAWGVQALVSLAPVQLPRMGDIGVDWRVLAFTFCAALATGVIFGGVAAWPATRMRLTETLKEAGRGSSGRGHARQGLVAAQSALSMLLLVGAGLLVATLMSLRSVDPGFRAEGVTAVRFPFQPPAYGTTQARWRLEQRVTEELAARGIRQATAASNLPLQRGLNIPVTIAGRPDDFEGAVEWRAVAPAYFSTLDIDLLAGRTFGVADAEGTPPVAIVNEAFARQYFPDGNAIGQHIEVGRFKGQYVSPVLDVPAAEIVGVVPDVRDVSLKVSRRRTVYVPQAQAPALLTGMPVFLVRGPRGGGETERVVREALRAVDTSLPEADVIPLGEVVTRSLARERFGAFLLSAFAALALFLTAFGVYGVLAYTVRQRRREIGIRIALGAGRAEVTRMVARQGLAPVVLGLLVGTAAALALSRVAAGLVWGVSPTDPRTIAVVATLLLGVAAAASLAPAREAVATDPVRSLNDE